MSQARAVAPPARSALVWLAATGTAGLLQAWLLPHLVRSADSGLAGLTGERFELLLVAGCELVASLCIGWLWALVTLTVVDALRGRVETSRRGIPRPLRRLVLTGCGLSLTGVLVAPSQAAPGPDPTHHTIGPGQVLAGLPLPDRMSTTRWLGAALARAPQRPTTAGRHVTVARGDTLWDLAARDLAADAGPAQIDRRWRQIYRANREAIGEDPDLIRPGQRLLLPPTASRRG